MGRLRASFRGQALSVLCALALSLVAFGHRPVETGARALDPQVAAYLALGGSPADLCLTGESGEENAGAVDCPACALAKSMALAALVQGPGETVEWSADPAFWPGFPRLSGRGPRAPPARGPPFLLMI